MTVEPVFAEPAANYLDQLVGEGKKYATPEDLAKAYINADGFIGTLKTELQDSRTELEKRETAEDILKRVTAERAPPVTPTVVPVTTNAPVQSDEDLDSRVTAILSKAEQNKQLLENTKTVITKLVDVYGSEAKANEVIVQKSKELGMSVKELQETAARSPRAFYTLVGLESQPKAAPAVHPSLNSAATTPNGAKPGTWKYYSQLKKENPTLYQSPKIQAQMHEDALRDRDAFFGS
jgi:hypothetical protein